MRLIVSATVSFLILLLMSSMVTAQFTLDDQDLGTYITIGAAWGDYDEDGDEDLYLANGSLNGDLWVNYLYTNDGAGNFTQETDAGTIVTDAFTSGGCSWGDYNDDGLLDMLVAHPVTNSASPYESKNSLYLNNGDGTFSDLGSDPLTDIVTFSRIDPAGADWNKDGFLDIVCSNATFFGTGSNHAFFTNDGDGTFTSVSNELTAGTSARGTVNWVDIDQDGDMDVLTASGAPGQQTILWVNNGADFDELLLVDSGPGVGQDTKSASFGDFDNDGDFDLYLANSGDNPDTNLVFRNDGLDDNNLPVLTKLGEEFGDPATDVDYSLTSGWADVDNDGDLDLFVGNDGGYPDYNSKIYINDNGAFTDGTSGDLLTSADFAHTAAFADIESDGDLDLIVGRDGQNRLFVNNIENGNNWVGFKLSTTESNTNKSAIGTIIKVIATINEQQVVQVRQVDSHSGAGSQNSYILHFGLGDAAVIDELIVQWAGSGITETEANWTDINGIYELEEGFISALEKVTINQPQEFELFQNYPNPFNPETAIQFTLQTSANVSLKVYDIKGREMARLADGMMNAGEHTVQLNAENWTSGVYFYTLTAGSEQTTRKMMLLK